MPGKVACMKCVSKFVIGKRDLEALNVRHKLRRRDDIIVLVKM